MVPYSAGSQSGTASSVMGLLGRPERRECPPAGLGVPHLPRFEGPLQPGLDERVLRPGDQPLEEPDLLRTNLVEPLAGRRSPGGIVQGPAGLITRLAVNALLELDPVVSHLLAGVAIVAQIEVPHR